jgi:hypothetical protein
MFLGCETGDKICHMSLHVRKRRREAGLRGMAAGELIKSMDTEEVEPQITQIETDYLILISGVWRAGLPAAQSKCNHR